ncbi:hypothetical protein FACS1894158_16520 [Betaproteobacteria bacterium]|nr:hypothetical protein FACS1894158_16520 [Betaproteobacteria bacterium]
MNIQTHALIFIAHRNGLMAVPESARRCGKSGRNRRSNGMACRTRLAKSKNFTFGAQLAGDTVRMDIGGNLLIETLQDLSHYKSQQSSSGFNISLCIPPICYGNFVQSASFYSASQKIKHNYRSAVGQSGIAAGDGGFDITVKGGTELIGAAITSTQTAIDEDRNSLTTASLKSSDLKNVQSTESSGSSVGLSYSNVGGGGNASFGASIGSNGKSLSFGSGSSILTTLASNALSNLNSNSTLPGDQDEHRQTLSVISPANITITGTGNEAIDGQSKETVALLTSRDPETANQSLTNTLNLQQAQILEEKIQKQKENQEAARIAGEVLDSIVGDLTQAIRKPVDDANERQRLDTKLEKGEEPLTDAERITLARLDREGMSSEQAVLTLQPDSEALKQFNAWKEGNLGTIALHGLVGAIEAKIGDGSLSAGVLSKVGGLFANEAYRTSFLEEARFYKVARDDEGKVVTDKAGHPVMTELSNAEKLALKPEPGGKLNVFTNGMNNDESTAGKYAVQMSMLPVGQNVYMVYYPQADNVVSELLVVGYQKFLEGNIGDLANATQEIKDLGARFGEEGLNLIGYSRGAMTIGNALASLASNPEYEGILSNTTVRLVSPAYNAQNAANLLDWLSGGQQTTVQLENHADDFVGTIIGWNPSTYGNRPEGSSRLNEWYHIFGGAPTAHSCGGTMTASPGCSQYGPTVTITVPSTLQR